MVVMKDIDNVVFTDEILEKYKDDSEKITELCKKIDKNKKVQEEYKKFLKGEEKLLHAYEKLEQENKILKENAENNDKVVDKVNWENMLLKKENQKLKDELKNKPDTQITLQDDKGNKFILIQTERIDIQVELNKTIEKLFNNWNKLKEWLKKELGDRINPNKDKWLTGVYDAYRETIDKMQELQGSDESEKNQC